jgi:hypothetical protein
MPKQGLPTNTQIQNQASVVFDTNAPVPTPTWSNALDNTPPTSSVQPLPPIEPNVSFSVSWTGTDVGSGIQYYNIYASDNGGAFTVWQQNTTATFATFTPQLGHTYGFYSIATDNVGNVEAAKTSAEASTVDQDFTLTAATATATVAPGSAASYSVSLTGEGGFNQNVSFACTGAPSEATCTVSPTSAAVGSSATSVTVTVTTTAPSLSAPRPHPAPPASPRFTALRVLWGFALFLAMIAWAVVCRNKGGVGRLKYTLAPLEAALLLTLALAGCGGGGGGGAGGTSNPGTPAGTYTITVTGSYGSGSSAFSHSVALTLTVS